MGSTVTDTSTAPAVEKPSSTSPAPDSTPGPADPGTSRPHERQKQDATPTKEEQPPPSADPGAYETGQEACRGMTPREAAERFEMPARHAGASKAFAAAVADPAPAVEGSPGYPRLVAALYATTLPPRQRAGAAAGCAAELASRGAGG